MSFRTWAHSIPGLLAKPILDIDIIVPSEAVTEAARKALVLAGYEDRGEMDRPGRVALRQPKNTPPDPSLNCAEVQEYQGQIKMKTNTYIILAGCFPFRIV